MRKSKVLSAILKLVSGFVTILLLLFVPAGTFNYVGGLIFLTVLFVPMIVCGVFLAVKNPELLEKRLNTKERQNEQRNIILLSALMFIAGFVSSGLCFRFDFLMLPIWGCVAAAIVFLAGFVLYFVVISQNKYLSRTIEVSKEQKVVDTGLYSVVRHPMYLSTILMFMSVPIMLGSAVSFVIFCAYPFIIAKRIKYEEMLLVKELCGYEEYRQRVKYKLIPKIY